MAGENCDTEDISKKCANCGRSAKADIKCTKCNIIYHASCAVRVKGIEVMGFNALLCPNCVDTDKDVEIIKTRCDMLNSLVLEIQDKNQLLTENKYLLQEKVVYLEEKLKNIETEVKTLRKNKAIQKSSVNPNQSTGLPQHVPALINNHQNPESAPEQIQLTTSHNQQRKADNNRRYQSKPPVFTKSEVNKAINSAMFNSNIHQKTNVVNSKRHNTGSAVNTESNGFISAPRKMWLYIGKVAPNVSCEQITNWIKNRGDLSESDFEIQPLESKGNSKAFRLGIDPQHFEMMNKCEFWPTGIAFRRFNFRKREIVSGQTELRNFHHTGEQITTS